jgi:CspA family cold shock protein
MQVGIVRSFDEEKGFGFIESDDGQVIFVHHSNIEMEGFRILDPGDKVFYNVHDGKRGLEAKNVRKI